MNKERRGVDWSVMAERSAPARTARAWVSTAWSLGCTWQTCAPGAPRRQEGSPFSAATRPIYNNNITIIYMTLST